MQTKDKQLDSMLRLVTDASTCFVGFLKGYYFFLFFFFVVVSLKIFLEAATEIAGMS